MSHNPLSGLKDGQFSEERDYTENQALTSGNLTYRPTGATFATKAQAKAALLALQEAGFEDASLEVIRSEDVRRASAAASAAQGVTSAEFPDPRASTGPAAYYVNDALEGNGPAHVTVMTKNRAAEAQNILQQNGGKLDVTTDKGAS